MPDAIQISGLREVESNLALFDQNLQSKATRMALRAAGQVMRDGVSERAPVRPEMPSATALPIGALKSDVTLRVTQRDGVLMAIIQPGRLTRRVARWVEYGHRLVKGGYNSFKRGKFRGPGRKVGNVPAYPYIRPAFESLAGQSVEAFVEELKTRLKSGGANVD